MLARLQRLIATGIVFWAAAWAGVALRSGHTMLVPAGAILILVGYAAFLGFEFMLLTAVQSDAIVERPTAHQLLKAWWGELLVAPAVFLWRQPFRAQLEQDNVAVPSRGTHGVVLVHGFVCNRAFWNPWMRRLRARQAPFVAVNLEPLFGSIDEYSDCIERAVVLMEAATRLPVVLVGHSMGGVAIRAWMAKFDGSVRVRRIITIGSPHHGTWLARFGHTLNGSQMRQESSWLTALAAAELPEHYSLFTCFFSHCDNIVFPAPSAVLPGASNVHIAATAHVCMAFNPLVFEELQRWLPVAPPADAEA